MLYLCQYAHVLIVNNRTQVIKMARKSIGAIQSDPEVKKRLRGEYAENAELLILSAQVVTIEFQTVAAANNYWR